MNVEYLCSSSVVCGMMLVWKVSSIFAIVSLSSNVTGVSITLVTSGCLTRTDGGDRKGAVRPLQTRGVWGHAPPEKFEI